MLVSVIVPCYNLGRYLDDCISSIKKQRLDPSQYEVLIVDDCSTDNSYDIACGFLNIHDAPCRMSVYKTPVNLYLSGALNYGIERARGKYIIPLDADNMFGSDRTLEILCGELEKNIDLDIVYGGLDVLEEDGRQWKSSWPPTTFSFDVQLGGKDQIPSTSMYRKKLWKRVGGYRRYPRTAEDALFYTQAVALGARARKVTETTTLVYRNRPDSMSHVEKAWHWEQCAPSKPLWTPSTHEPVEVCIVVEESGVEPMRTFDSLWAQNFDRWKCYFVNQEPNEWLPSWVKQTSSVEDALTYSDAKYELILEGGAYFDHRDALKELVGSGDLMACGACGQKRSGMVGGPLPKIGGPRLARGKQVSAEREEDTVLIEYIGGGGMTMRGNAPRNQTYYFNTSASHRIKKVYVSDAEKFLRHTMFRKVDAVEDAVVDAVIPTLTHEVAEVAEVEEAIAVS